MRIQKTDISFKRALSTQEKAKYQSCIKQAREALGLNNSTAILFDYMVPSEQNKNIGIGTTFSENAQKFGKFLKELLGINSIQINPQGILKNRRFSPYGSGATSIGTHIIDIFQLATPAYQNILTSDDFNKYLIEENPNTVNHAQYDKLLWRNFSENPEKYPLEALMKKAFSNFQKQNKNSDLQKEFSDFKDKNKTWLTKESLYYALAKKHKSHLWKEWKNEEHQNLFLKKDKQTIQKLENELNQEIEFLNFVQFIAHKQLQTSKKLFNQQGIKIYGDIPIGFSLSEQWGNKDIFQNDYTYGFMTNGNYYDWNVAAPDLDKIKNPEDKEKILTLFKNRFEHNLKRYDGIRIDAAWELVNPCVGKKDGNRKIGIEINNIDDSILQVLEKTLKETKSNNYSTDNLVFEILEGQQSINTTNYLKNKYPFTHITHNHPDYTRSVNQYKEDGFKEDFLTVGIGTHDNNSLIASSNQLNGTIAERLEMLNDINALAMNMNVVREALFSPDFYRTIKFAELFTNKNQFFNTFDLLGFDKYINIGDVILPDNWKNRIPINYEKAYFSNLQQNKGLNLPESLYYALKAKYIDNPELEAKLIHFAKILKENGPLTEAEANLIQNN